MILASNSKRRQEILRDMGFNFKVLTADIEEISDKKEISEMILDIAEKKLDKIAKENVNEFVLAADTVVELEGRIFGKPKSREEAKSFLKILSGKTHKVITAYVFKNISKNIVIKDVVISKVKFYDLDDETIKWYLNTSEPFDKAGAYGIQGQGRALVERIEGDYFAIMGFPVSNFLKNLRKNGYKISQIDRI
ncbi:Maf family protein [Fusobacterium pseudoperiodonticum]|uniref:Maf family protein n=1 Tax=Fusobacterium pseudoperiodonticum TaxID=2663009 RepID=UPI0028E57AB5|nr:Maf family protein [Fusobacterium pseudoperiodonticum]